MEGGPMIDANRSFYSQRNSQMEMENCTTEIKWGGWSRNAASSKF